MSLPIPTLGLGLLEKLQPDQILSKVLVFTFQPLKSVNLRDFTGRVRVVITPVIDTDVMGASHGMAIASTQALRDIITGDGGILRMSVFSTVGGAALWKENVTLGCLNSMDWTRFSEVQFQYPRTRALAFPKLFPIVPGSTRGNYFVAEALVPSAQYPTMPVFELFWDGFFLTINVITTNEYWAVHQDLRPAILHPKPCVNEQHNCRCSTTHLFPTLIQTGITVSVRNYVSPTPVLTYLDIGGGFSRCQLGSLVVLAMLSSDLDADLSTFRLVEEFPALGS
ncbi:hypothetical protein IFR05_003099 [Cadophora sp. M221]|nr:hypothetical protein IFR05_003099 [Cadophora sp. M221]